MIIDLKTDRMEETEDYNMFMFILQELRELAEENGNIKLLNFGNILYNFY
jgi:hypothetical protein